MIGFVICACIAFLAVNGLVALFADNTKRKRKKQMRQIFVLERNDREPFDFPTTPVKVVGIGFATKQEAAAIVTLMPNSKDFVIQTLIEGPVAPISLEPPEPNQIN